MPNNSGIMSNVTTSTTSRAKPAGIVTAAQDPVRTVQIVAYGLAVIVLLFWVRYNVFDWV